MKAYYNPVNHIKSRELLYTLMIIFGSFGMLIGYVLYIFYLLGYLFPLVGMLLFYTVSILFFRRFWKKGEAKTPEILTIGKDHFGWRESDGKVKIKYDQVESVERIYEDMYTIKLKGVHKDEIFLYWALAEEIEERAGKYPPDDLGSVREHLGNYNINVPLEASSTGLQEKYDEIKGRKKDE